MLLITFSQAVCGMSRTLVRKFVPFSRGIPIIDDSPYRFIHDLSMLRDNCKLQYASLDRYQAEDFVKLECSLRLALSKLDQAYRDRALVVEMQKNSESRDFVCRVHREVLDIQEAVEKRKKEKQTN